MHTTLTSEHQFVLTLANAWGRIETRLDRALGAIRGISLAEYRILRALGEAPNARASRVDLASKVGLTASGITRALRPMEKTGIISTLKSKRDARLAIAALTPAGRELLDDAATVVDEVVHGILRQSGDDDLQLGKLAEFLENVF